MTTPVAPKLPHEIAEKIVQKAQAAARKVIAKETAKYFAKQLQSRLEERIEKSLDASSASDEGELLELASAEAATLLERAFPTENRPEQLPAPVQAPFPPLASIPAAPRAPLTAPGYRPPTLPQAPFPPPPPMELINGQMPFIPVRSGGNAAVQLQEPYVAPFKPMPAATAAGLTANG